MLIRLSVVNLLKISKDITYRNMHLLVSNKAFVNGEWVEAKSKDTFDVVNPAEGCVVGKVPNMSVEDVELAIKAANEAFECWKHTTNKERSVLLRNWYNLLNDNVEELAKIMTLESGKPLIESRVEANYGNGYIEYFSEIARSINGEIIPSSIKTKQYFVTKQPIGVAAFITPWNFPHAMIARKAGAALAAGCTCIVKPAEDTPLTALALANLAYEAGIPKGVFNVVTSDRKKVNKVGELLCTSPDIAGVSFTGSTEVGKLLYKMCSTGIKRIGLELGGNAPFIIFSSANIDKAVTGAMQSKFRNCGQTCVSANRFLIQDDIFDEFISKFKDAISKLVIGNGLNETTTIGPLINKQQFNKVEAFVNDAVDKGAKVIIGGSSSDQGELYYTPTLLTDIKPNMKLYTEEVFGPVAACIRFRTEEEAIQIANSTRRGLASYFYSENYRQIFRVAKEIESGMVGVNEGIISAAEAPFGGVKESGIGREGSHHGIDEYVYIKYTCFGNLD